ncbi:permease prefix domain 1-containing protein [Streptomyces sp. NPDC005955]|uniref:permease prefix domain 1-containing protein n=1 Tax=Streptomyces sp. NPDC005955 TaxID=3364738 RepID=UPI003683E79F
MSAAAAHDLNAAAHDLNAAAHDLSVTGQRSTDPVDEYVTTLAAALRGPARVKQRLVEEIRDGLADTVAVYADGGMSRDRAARQAVHEFGTPDELVPSCQRELTIAQARHTARTVALTSPFLVACWYLVWNARTTWTGAGQEGPALHVAQLLAFHLATVAGAGALLAAALLAATGALARWLPTPDRLPAVVAWAGTTASAAMAVATVTLAVAALLAAQWTLIALAGALAAASHAVMAPSVRACRRCARLPVG